MKYTIFLPFCYFIIHGANAELSQIIHKTRDIDVSWLPKGIEVHLVILKHR